MREVELVRRIRQLTDTQHQNPAIIKGIGDDCAVIRAAPNRDLVFTTDLVLEGRHFALKTQKPADIGYRALARSLSDLAAMGSEPVFCLVSLAIPAHFAWRWLDGFYRGLLGLADRFKIAVAGGDLSRFDKVVADVMCCGAVPRGKAILRSGARPGDRIYVTGELGAAACSGWRRKPEPRIEAGLAVRPLVSAGIDLSDGLSLDLHRLCLESGVSANITSALPTASGATLEQALHAGEDYELLITAPRNRRVPSQIGRLRVTPIGVIARGTPGEVRLGGRPLPRKGFDHFV